LTTISIEIEQYMPATDFSGTRNPAMDEREVKIGVLVAAFDTPNMGVGTVATSPPGGGL